MRNHKDRLFRFVFCDKMKLLELYNAVSDSHYEDPDELEINTLEDVIYLSMKNDLSFLIGAEMNLYEHQSTWNQNIPERTEMHLSEAYPANRPNITPCLECTATVLNINEGKNQDLMEKCRSLYEYTWFVARARKFADSKAPNR